jgi:hypothetical protein
VAAEIPLDVGRRDLDVMAQLFELGQLADEGDDGGGVCRSGRADGDGGHGPLLGLLLCRSRTK